MSTTGTTTITTNGPLSSAAGNFITLVGKSDGQVTAKSLERTIDKPIFVLNSSDFVKLQAYVHAGIKAPSTASLFESEYPSDAFEKFFKVEGDLYKGLCSQIVLIHEHCEDFQGRVVAPMITTGGLVADFGEYSQDAISNILEAVKTLIDPKVTSRNPEFDDAKDTVRAACRKLVRRAEDVRENCDALVTDLGKFRSQTESDRSSLTNLNDRFHKVIPSLDKQHSELARLIQSARDMLQAISNNMAENQKEQIEVNKIRWYHWIPAVGLIITIHDYYKSGELIEQAKKIHQQYVEAQAKGKSDEAKLARAYTIINHLSGEVDSIMNSIDSAIASVQSMSTAFSLLSTNFKKVQDFISDVEGDIDERSLKERGLAIKDLESAKRIWEKVEVLGRDFQVNGGLLELENLDHVPKSG